MKKSPPRIRPVEERLRLIERYPDADSEWYEGALFFDDMDAAFIGFAEQFTNPPIAVYDYKLCLKCLRDGGMSEEDADEWFMFNTQGAWIGDRTPLIFYAPRALP